MTETPKRGGCFGRSIVTVVIALIVACVVCGIVAFVVAGPAISNLVNKLTAPITAGTNFMNALVAKDYTTAYGLIDPSQQTAFGGSADGLKQYFTTNGEISSYAFTGADSLTSGQVVLNYSAVFSGTTKYVSLILQQSGDAWKVVGYSVNVNPPTPIPTSSS